MFRSVQSFVFTATLAVTSMFVASVLGASQAFAQAAPGQQAPAWVQMVPLVAMVARAERIYKEDGLRGLIADFAGRGWLRLEPRAVVLHDVERLTRRSR